MSIFSLLNLPVGSFETFIIYHSNGNVWDICGSNSGELRGKTILYKLHGMANQQFSIFNIDDKRVKIISKVNNIPLVVQ